MEHNKAGLTEGTSTKLKVISSEEICKTLLERLEDLVDRYKSAESSLLKELDTPVYLASDIAIEHQFDIATGISRLWGIEIKLSRILAHGKQNNEQQLKELLKKLYLIPPPPLEDRDKALKNSCSWRAK